MVNLYRPQISTGQHRALCSSKTCKKFVSVPEQLISPRVNNCWQNGSMGRGRLARMDEVVCQRHLVYLIILKFAESLMLRSPTTTPLTPATM